MDDRPDPDPQPALDELDDVEVEIDDDLDDEVEVEIEWSEADDEADDDDADDADEADGHDESDDDVGEIDEVIEDGRISYECNTWAGESRGMLASLLESNGIPHAWQGTTVTVLAEDEAVVDALIDDVMASARPALDPDAPKVVYEVGAWPASLQTSLADALTVADLPYEWDEQGDLVIYAEHEEEVEAILEQLPDPDDPELDTLSADDGLAVHERLDALFTGSDRLARHPDDASAVVRVDGAVADLERMPPPFGFEPPQWRALVGRAVQLRDALSADPGDDAALDDGDLKELAGEVRDLVRQYV